MPPPSGPLKPLGALSLGLAGLGFVRRPSVTDASHTGEGATLVSLKKGFGSRAGTALAQRIPVGVRDVRGPLCAGLE